MTVDPYKTLGVTRKSTDREIKSAYRQLARQWHPDLNHSKGAEDKFKEIAAAYEILSNEAKRRAYDSAPYVPPTMETVRGQGFSVRRAKPVVTREDFDLDNERQEDQDPMGEFDADWEPPA